MNAVQMCACAFIGVSVILLLRDKYREFAFLTGAAACVIIIYGAVYKNSEAVSYITAAVSQSTFSAYVPILIKALGIAYITHFTADMCRSSGELGLCSAVEVFGKSEIVLISLPMIRELIDISKELLLS